MKRLVISEHTRIDRRIGPLPGSMNRACLDARLYDRLRAFDRVGRDARDQVFEWSDGYARTTQWVGVVQVPGVQVEILPKADVLTGTRPALEYQHHDARCNLLYMLSVSGDLPVRSRDLAQLATRRAPLLETLSAIFAERLRRELLRGPERGYLEQADNLRCLKGKLLVARQTLENAAHRERFWCRFDEFSEDTLMNRVFRAACRHLLEVTRTPTTQDLLRQCLLLLDDVSETYVCEADFGRISLNRQNERFKELLQFCRLLLSGRTPTAWAGRTHAFSLLFDMNKVFERFVAAFLRRYVAVRLPGVRILPHAGYEKRHLLECEGVGILRLEPDILVEGLDGRMVIDTKWKLLSPGKKGRNGVAEADLYQLYAYARRYGCARSVLLYPHTNGLEASDFHVLDADGALSSERISVRQIRLQGIHQDHQRQNLTRELEVILREGLEPFGGRSPRS